MKKTKLIERAFRQKEDFIILKAPETTTTYVENFEIFGAIRLVSCCKVGPITDENYCPYCGKKIIK